MTQKQQPDNVAASSYGGGIASYFNAPESSLRIADSIITGNSALQGGGVYNTNPNVLVTNSTFNGNTPDDCVNCQP